MRRQHERRRPLRHPELHHAIDEREAGQSRNGDTEATSLDLDAIARQYGYDRMSKADFRAMQEEGEDRRYALLLSLDDAPAAHKALWRNEYDWILYHREMYRRMWLNGVGSVDMNAMTEDERQALCQEYEARRATWKPLSPPERVI